MITNATFSKPARAFASKHEIHLIDAERLQKWATWGDSFYEVIDIPDPFLQALRQAHRVPCRDTALRPLCTVGRAVGVHAGRTPRRGGTDWVKPPRYFPGPA
ncbi:restriction endonuclease [Streptomyces sp. NPDC060366]|uniref:restriction endonuclease n=1 Tax=Streptomyces sp. NPDC060366 TaxID=3347105 RepID=UPI00365CB0FB